MAISIEFFLRQQNALGMWQTEKQNTVLTPSMEADATAIRDALRREALGWFLLDWHAGRDDDAASKRRGLASSTPVAVAMDALLERGTAPELVAQRLSPDYEFLVGYVAGERALRRGDVVSATAEYQRTIAEIDAADAERAWWKRMIGDRLKSARAASQTVGPDEDRVP